MSKGNIFYFWPGNGIEEGLRFYDSKQFGTEPYDVVIVGAGVVGCALAYKLSQFQLRVLLIDKGYYVGEGTSKANSALLSSGFDTTVGTLETRLCREASSRWPNITEKLKIPYDRCGCLMVSVTDEQTSILRDIQKQAIANGIDDVQWLTTSEIHNLEPNVTPDAQCGIYSPREAIGDPFTTVIAFAEVALVNGVDILLGAPVIDVEAGTGDIKKLLTSGGHNIETRILINSAGLGSRELANQYGGADFDINPRRGQFLILDPCSRSLVSRPLLPVPDPVRGRGILVIPTVYGGLLTGPTAEDLPYGMKNPTDTTVNELDSLLDRASGLCPPLAGQPVIGSFAGARCNCTQGSYIIRYNDGCKGIITVTGIRSTGFSTCISLADYLIEGLTRECGLAMIEQRDAIDNRPESRWPGWWKRRFEEEGLLKEEPDYGRLVCYCEQVSRGELIDALDSPLKPRTLDAIKRQTMAQMGRCQGFDCRIQIAEIISEHCGIPMEKITMNGYGSELVAAKI
jgi:glycerol-3-phosphate dehydrogenase